MIQLFTYRIINLLALTLIQVVVFNNIHLFGYATALTMGHMLLCFPRNTSPVTLLVWGFATGLLYDTFSNTAGMGAASFTLAAMCRTFLADIYSRRSGEESVRPSFKSQGVWRHILYIFSVMLILHAAFYLLDAFTLSDWMVTLTAIVSGAALATIFSLVAEAIPLPQSSK